MGPPLAFATESFALAVLSLEGGAGGCSEDFFLMPGAAVFPPFSLEVAADVVFVGAAAAVTDFVLVVAPTAVPFL